MDNNETKKGGNPMKREIIMIGNGIVYFPQSNNI